MLTNIIDFRKRPYRFKNINAIIEPTRHDNKVKDADHAAGSDTWMGYDEREHISVEHAVKWAAMHSDEVTLYLYDEDDGIYVTKGEQHKDHGKGSR